MEWPYGFRDLAYLSRRIPHLTIIDTHATPCESIRLSSGTHPIRTAPNAAIKMPLLDAITLHVKPQRNMFGRIDMHALNIARLLVETPQTCDFPCHDKPLKKKNVENKGRGTIATPWN